MTGDVKSQAGRTFWISVALAFLVLIGLGTWQLQRREWKLALIERIESRAHGEPISLSFAKDLWSRARDVEYYRVLLVGRFRHEFERHLFTVDDGKAGWRVITPLATASGDLVLVDRGFVPEELENPSSRPQGQIDGQVELIGLARAPVSGGWFTPPGDAARKRWFSRDVAGIAASLPDDQTAHVVPFVVEAEAEPIPGGWPRAGGTRLELPNRHLEYALTWYVLALTLLAVAFAYGRSRTGEIARQL